MIIYDPKITGSFQINGSTISSVGEIDNLSGSVAALNNASSSYLLNTTDTLTGNLTVTGTLTAQEFHTEYTSASIVYQSGSTKFGDSADDTHIFTGTATFNQSIVGESTLNVAGNIGIGIGTAPASDKIYSYISPLSPSEYLSSGVTLYGTSTYGNIPALYSSYLSGDSDVADDTIKSFRAGASGSNAGRNYVIESQTKSSSTWDKRFIIATDGNVGIGTNSPSYITHIQGTGDHRLYLFNSGSTSSDKAVFQAEVAGSSSGNAYAFFGRTGAGWSSGVNVSSNKYVIRSNWDVTEDASARLIIDSSGNVGIGATSPGYKLEVNGDVGFSGGASLKWGGNTYLYGDNNIQIQAVVNGNTGWFINSSGNVGIGTTSPVSKFNVVTSGAGGISGTAEIQFATTGSNLVLKSNNNGSAAAVSAVSLYSNPQRAKEVSFYDLSTNSKQAYLGYVYSSGSPITSLNLNNILEGSLVLSTNNSPRMSIQSDGNVGIGSTSPTEKLDVAGGIKSYSYTYGSGVVGPDDVVNSLEGLVGWYTADSFDDTSNVWYDISGNGNHTISYRGNPTAATFTASNNSSKTFTCVSGSTSDGLRFPSAILPSTYTLFHVARYGGPNQKRIIDGVGSNWLSGFWDGKSGQAYHNGWITDSTSDYFGDNWVISSDQKSYYGGQSGGTLQQSTGGGGSYEQLSINHGAYTYGGSSESSDWQVAEVIVYNRELDVKERRYVEKYLANKYGIEAYNNYFEGKVGIGTTTATHKLTVTDGAAPYVTSNDLVQIKRNATNGNDDTSRASIILGNISNAFTIAYGGTTDRLRFIDGSSTERFTIVNGGNVGIGTTSPQNQLHVVGGIRFTSTGADSNRWSVYWNGSNGDLIVVSNISDIRAKKDLDYNINGLETVQKLKPVKFTWKDGTSHSTSVSGRLRQYGFTAQETMEADNYLAWHNQEQDTWGIEQYESFSAVMVKAIQEQQAIIEDLKARIQTLENS